MLVGAIIIIFAIVFVGKVGIVEQQKQNVVVAKYLDLFFNPFASIGAIAEGFGKRVELPYEINAEFRCVGGEERVIVGSGNKRGYEKLENFVYSPSRLKTKELSVFSKPFNLPFRVTDLIFVFDTSHQFCLLYDDDFSKSIVDSVVEDVSDNLGDADNFVKCKTLNCCQPDARVISFKSRAIQGEAEVTISDESNGRFDYGRIFFSDGKNIPFVGFPLVEAAVFSDYEIYSCNFQRLMKKISAISEIYQGKASFLGRVKQRQICNYGSFSSDLEKMKGAAQNSNAKLLFTVSEELSERNRNFPCAQLY